MIDLTGYRLILGSGSPRRKQLLEDMGLHFDVIPAQCEEIVKQQLSFGEAAEDLAKQKADAFVDDFFNDDKMILITSDTIVCTETQILGKPMHKEHALKMFEELSGKTHEVITGVCIKSKACTKTFHVATSVTFAKLTEEEVNHYLEVYKPYDKAGAYGIQEWIGLIGVEHIEGSYFNVMGLPTHRLYSELKCFLEN